VSEGGDCVFCRILQREAPAAFVYEDDEIAAFLDLYPVHAGHTLVVPKRHVTDLLACPGELAARLFAVSSQLARAVVVAAGADGFNVWTANGRAAGQTVFHLHLHVLPRFRTDAFGLRFPKDYPRQADPAALAEMAERIRKRA
jgi:histidine triad (HIT) family protein